MMSGASCRRLGLIAALTFVTGTAACAPASIERLQSALVVSAGVGVDLVSPLPASFRPETFAVAPKSPYLITTSEDSTLVVWDIDSGRHLRVLRHEGVSSVAFHPDAQVVASGGRDGTVRIWELKSGIEKLRLRIRPPSSPGNLLRTGEIVSVAFSPDGSYLFAGADSGLYQIDLAANRIHTHYLSGMFFSDTAYALDFSRDGKYMGVGGYSGGLVVRRDDGEAVWHLKEHQGRVLSMAFSPDGSRLATGGDDGNVIVRSIASRHVIAQFRAHNAAVLSLAFSEDGKLIATGSMDKTARVWNANGTQEYSSMDFAVPVRAVGFQPRTGYVLASGGYIVAWSPETGKLKQLYGSRVGIIPTTLTLSPDGRHVLGGVIGGDIVIWDLHSGRQVRRFEQKERSSWGTTFGSGDRIASFSYQGRVYIWDFRTGEKIFELPEHAGSVSAIEFSPDGSSLLTAADDGVRIWRLPNLAGKGVPTVVEHIGRWSSIFDNGVVAASYSPTGKKVAIATLDNRAVVRDLKTGEVVKLGNFLMTQARAIDFFGNKIRSSSRTLQISYDDTRVLGGGKDKVVRLWDANSGAELQTFLHGAPVNSVAFSKDALQALSAGGLSVSLWDLKRGRRLWEALGHSAEVVGAAFTENGRVISASGDGTWRVWSAANGHLLLTYILTANGEWLAFTPDGLFDGTPELWGTIQWRFNTDIADVGPIELFFQDFFRPGLLSDILNGKDLSPLKDIRRLDRRQPGVEIVRVDRLRRPLPERDLARVRIRVTEAAPNAEHVRGSGVRDLRLFRNGVRNNVWTGELVADSGGSVELETLVPIAAGQNRLTAYAFNRDGVKSSDAEFNFEIKDLPPRPAKAFVIAIGINSYEQGWRPLSYARSDAELFLATLQRYLKELGTYGDPVRVDLLGERATRANIVNTFRRLGGDSRAPLPVDLSHLGTAQPEDVVLIFFSGHGTADADRFYFHPYDARPAPRPTSISDRDLEQLVDAIKVKELSLIIDSCHSGGLLGSEEVRVGPLNSQGLAQLAWEKGMTILAASQNYESALESVHHGHGLLTYAAVREGLLEGKADVDPTDHKIVLQEWFDYVSKRVPDLYAEVARDRIAIAEERSRLLGAESNDDAPQLVKHRPVETQQPRVFYRREPSTDPFVVRRTPSLR